MIRLAEFNRRGAVGGGCEWPNFIYQEYLKEFYMNKQAAKKKLNKTISNMTARAIAVNNEWHSIRSMLGHTWAIFYGIIGAREAGKSYSVMK